MGHNLEAKNHEIPSPYTNRVNDLRQLLNAANAQVNALALNRNVDSNEERSIIALNVRQDRLLAHANFLRDRRQGFARQHTQISMLKGLVSAAVRNGSEPVEVYPPLVDTFLTPQLALPNQPSMKEYDVEGAMEARQQGIDAVLWSISDPYVGQIERNPFLESGTYLRISELKNGMVLLETPTRFPQISVRHLGIIDGERMEQSDMWITVSQVPTTI